MFSFNFYSGHNIDPFRLYYKNTNEKSLVMRLSAKNKPNSKSMLFMGDIDIGVIPALLQRHYKMRSDVWVLPLHGAAPQTQVGTLQYVKLAKAISAKEIIISSDIKGSYGHPRCETIRNVAPKMNANGNAIEFNRVPPQIIEDTCKTSLEHKDKEMIQCWSVSEESPLYESYFCDSKSLGVRIRQTTQQDMNGYPIWNDITTDIVEDKKRRTN